MLENLTGAWKNKYWKKKWVFMHCNVLLFSILVVFCPIRHFPSSFSDLSVIFRRRFPFSLSFSVVFRPLRHFPSSFSVSIVVVFRLHHCCFPSPSSSFSFSIVLVFRRRRRQCYRGAGFISVNMLVNILFCIMWYLAKVAVILVALVLYG